MSSVKIHETALIYGDVEIGEGTVIYPYVVIGDPYKETGKITIGKNSIIRSFSNIEGSTNIGDNFHLGERCLIRSNTIIGNNVSIGNLCDIQGNLTIGDYVRIHSNVYVAMHTTIGDYAWIFSYVMITNDKHPPHGNFNGVSIKDYAIICAKSTLMAGITVGENSLVGANSLVLYDVGDNEVWLGSPAIKVCDIQDLGGGKLYPWKEHLKTNRGYPWQN